MDWLTSFLLILAAEIGDKSQLVCMGLAVRYRAIPVALGAILAFLFLNTLAVVFGSAIAQWIPQFVLSLAVSLMFLLFGIHALLAKDNDDDISSDELKVKSQQHIFLSTFALIALAEFGDKTQLAVVGLSSQLDPLAVWLGASSAMIVTTIMAIWIGRTILQRIPIVLLHRFSGALFVLLAALAGYSAYLAF